MTKRRWLISVRDDRDEEIYLDENGKPVDYSDAKEFIADEVQAALETDRRANLWENLNMGIALRATYHSQGKVND